jgi:8-oxo-dGTP pyrophosphatase MutT (NUDIX family)
MPRILEKVTAFITSDDGRSLLLFQHPNAGVQIPAGTVEADETPAEAVLREAAEETGLAIASLSVRRYLGCREAKRPEGHVAIAEGTNVYALPDAGSYSCAFLRAGNWVAVNRRAQGFSNVTYREWDRVPDPQYIALQITGWVPDAALAYIVHRHFYHLHFDGDSKERWTVFADHGHSFQLFWAPLNALPEIIFPQNTWLEMLLDS